jgi:hypothetical protein
MHHIFHIDDKEEKKDHKEGTMKKNIAPYKNYAFLLVLLSCLPACVHKKQIDKRVLYIDRTPKKTETIIDSPPPITVWVHGTLIFRTPAYYKIFKNRSCLVHAQSLPENHHFKVLADTITERDPEHFSAEEFYIFSWSGKLLHQERINASEKLYNDLVALTIEYQKKYNCYPVIRIITHSHGGNVALNMAKIKDQPFPLRIKSLILLACPVQDRTMHFINTPLFERVYSLYSSFDLIQIIAPQFHQNRPVDLMPLKKRRRYKMPLFSSRVFPHHPHVMQAKIKIDHYPISHTRFSTTEFAQILPNILQTLDTWDEQAQKNNTLHKHKLLCIYHRPTLLPPSPRLRQTSKTIKNRSQKSPKNKEA